MGQRLVVTIKRHDDEILKAYFHWSAYLFSSIGITGDIAMNLINNDYKNMSDEEIQLETLSFIEEHGGGVRLGVCEDSEDYKAFYAIDPNHVFNENINRNDGLVAITEESMKSFDFWSEGDAIIDLDDEFIYNGVAWPAGDCYTCNDNDCFDVPCSPEEIPFDMISELFKTMYDNEHKNNIRYMNDIYF